MSIPNSFDPMGGGGIEIPFVQPIMTSDTTWREDLPYSCGMNLSTLGGEVAWNAFDGNEATRCTLKGLSKDAIKIIFIGKRIKVTKLSMLLHTYVDSYTYFRLDGSVDGVSFNPLIDRTIYSEQWEDFIIPEDKIASFKAIQIYYDNEKSGTRWSTIAPREVKIYGSL